MTEFEQQLLKTLKGIQREMVISNHKTERMKKIQTQYFELDDLRESYIDFISRSSGEAKEDLMAKLKDVTKKSTDLSLKGARDI